VLTALGLNSISASDPAPDPPRSRSTAAAVRLLPTPSAVTAVSFAKDECTHSDRRHRARSAFLQLSRSVVAVLVLKPTCVSAQAPVPPHKVAQLLGGVRLLTSLRSTPGAVNKVARRMAFHVLKHDADHATCMAVTDRISSNVLGDRCEPSRPSAQCTWCTDDVDRRRE
jgi:hypothetical protein